MRVRLLPPGLQHSRGEYRVGLAEALRLEVGYCIAAADLSQAAVARHLGISQKHLCRMLTGRASMSVEWAERIASACGHRLTVHAREEVPVVIDTS